MTEPTYPEHEDAPIDDAEIEPGWDDTAGAPVEPEAVEAPEGIQPYELATEQPETDWWQPLLGCCVPEGEAGTTTAVEEPTVTWIDPSGTPQLLPAVDANGDGVADTVMIDTNGDGVHDAWAIDTDASGTVDAMFLDADGDGFADAVTRDPGENGQWTEPEPIPATEGAPVPDTQSAVPAGGTAVGAESGPGGPPATGPGLANPANTITVGGYPADFPPSVNAYQVIDQLVNARQIAAAQGDAFSMAQIDALIAHWVDNPAADVWLRPTD